jgi:hypothetical protein
MDEVELPPKTDWKRELIHKHTLTGRIEKWIKYLPRRGCKRFIKAGCLAGLFLGGSMGCLLTVIWRLNVSDSTIIIIALIVAFLLGIGWRIAYGLRQMKEAKQKTDGNNERDSL